MNLCATSCTHQCTTSCTTSRTWCGCRYEHQEVALHCGSMLRECCRYEPLAKTMLHSEEFYKLFTYVEVSNFDIASDAFSTFKVPRPEALSHGQPLRKIVVYVVGNVGYRCS